MIEDDDMRAAFFDPDDFGEEVAVKPNGADAYTIFGIFDSRPMGEKSLKGSQVAFDGAQNTGNSPQLRCRSSDASTIKAGRALISVRGVDYSAWDVRPDHTGMTTIILKVA